MAQSDFGTINPATKSGAQLSTDLNSWRDALHSSHKGSTAPTYKVAGMFWLDDTTAATHLLKYYDGTDWITVLSMDTTSNRASIVTLPDRLSFPLAGGTANALTLTPSVPLTTYFDLDVFTFEAASNNTGATTLNVSGVGAKAIRKMVGAADVPLVAYDILDGVRYTVNFDTSADAWILAGHGVGVGSNLEAGSISAVASKTLDLTAYIAAGFTEFELVLRNLIPATDGAGLRLHVSTNGGSSILSSGYSYNFLVARGVTVAASGSPTAAGFAISDDHGNAAGESGNFTIRMDTGAGAFTFNSEGNHWDATTDNFLMVHTSGRNVVAANAIRVSFTAGNIASGSYVLRGKRSS